MSMTFRCDHKDTLVAFLYGEVDADLRRQVTAHLRACDACASELEGLQSVRRDLAEWQPPATELNFAIVQKPATVLRPPRWSLNAMPGWAQLAAAILVFTVGAAIANLQVRYGQDGLTMTTGWITPAPARVTNAPAPPADDWRPALTALASDLRRELQMVRSTTSEAASRPAAQPSIDSEALLRRVQALVTESERRQQQELAIRMTQFGREMQGDLVRVNQGFRQLQGRTGMVEGSQREMMNYLRRVSTQQVP